MSKNIEDKVKADLMMQIAQYEMQSTMTAPLPVETESQNEVNRSKILSLDDLHSVLENLSILLNDKNVITQMWPEAKDYADSDLFSHLHIEFDRQTSDVSIKTAGTTYSGMPIHSKTYSITGELTATPVSQLSQQEPIVAPQAVAAPTTAAQVST